MPDQYYKDAEGQLHWLSAEDHDRAAILGLDLPASDWVPISDAAAAVVINPPPTEADLWAVVRAERDARLLASDVYVWVDRWAGYTDVERAAWTNYRQALRDLPENTADPANPEWPEAPQ